MRINEFMCKDVCFIKPDCNIYDAARIMNENHVSSKKPPEYIKLKKDLQKKFISEEEYETRKNAITEIIELSKINGYRSMLRWARITRMKKISMLRVNFSGTIGTLDGTDMDKISEKISMELGSK